MQRDRVRALQLMQQALPLTSKENDKAALAAFYLHFANMLLNGAGYHEAWRLQYLTDLSQLPDYEEGYYWLPRRQRAAPRSMPTASRSYYHVPKSYEAAAERRRALALDARRRPSSSIPAGVNEIDMHLRQLPAQASSACRRWPTTAALPRRRRRAKNDKTGTFALHTLKDDETIAQLATGIKRFKLPDEFNWIKIYRARRRPRQERLRRAGPRHAGQRSTRTAGSTSRRPTPGRRPSTSTAPGNDSYRQKRLDQIVGNWGRFEPGQTQPAGKKAVVDFRFRNGNKVSFEAHAIKVAKLLDDVKAYLKSNPGTARLEQDQHRQHRLSPRRAESDSSTSATRSPPGTWT